MFLKVTLKTLEMFMNFTMGKLSEEYIAQAFI